jgi:6-pyruvoyltetrahydropterin/6-carboxytetrahydropterin synthase
MILRKQYRFQAAHHLTKVADDHPCRRMHGHGYRVVLECDGPVDPEMGWVFDFHALDAAWAPLHKRLDHHLLNEVEGLENPTSEALTIWIARRMAPVVARLAHGARLVRVSVSETDTSTAIFEVPIGFALVGASEIAGR